MIDMLLQSMYEHARQSRSLSLKRILSARPIVEGVQVRDDASRLGMIRKPVGIRLKHTLNRGVISRFRK